MPRADAPRASIQSAIKGGADVLHSRELVVLPASRSPLDNGIRRGGGIASSNATADAGVASGRPSKESAEQMALADCSRRGASDCRVIFTYRNQCVAWLVPNSQGAASRAGLPSAKEPVEARKLAQQSCVDTDGKSCQVAYEDCTKPVYESFQAVQRNTGFRALRFFWRVPSYSSSSAGVVLRSTGTSDTCSGANA